METKYIVQYKVGEEIGSRLISFENLKEMVESLAWVFDGSTKVEKIFQQYDEGCLYYELNRPATDEILKKARLLNQTETVTFTLESGEKLQYRGIKTTSVEMQTLLHVMTYVGVRSISREIEPCKK